MNDIGGPQIPNPNQPVVKAAERPAGTSREGRANTQQGQAREHDKAQDNDALKSRDPAVSIAATAAHIHIGDQLKHKVQDIDAEGRPIIVTEHATYALRPDAGLKTGDDVDLKIVEADKGVKADLLRLNGNVIDPPIRLHLIVIAIHTPVEPDQTGNQPQSNPVGFYSTPYKPNTQPGVQASTISQQLDPNLLSPQPQSGGQTNAPIPADNPDHGPARAASQDLAMLLKAQQSATEEHLKTHQPQPQNIATGNDAASAAEALKQAISHSGIHALQSYNLMSPWTQAPVPDASMANIQDTNPLNLSNEEKAAGALSKPFAMFTPDGAAIIVRHVDPAISQVPPANIAEITGAEPLSVNEARAVPLPVATFEAASNGILRLITSKGQFLIPANTGQSLVGEVLEIMQGQPMVATKAVNVAAAPSYSAKMDMNGTQQSVMVSFPESAQDNASTISAVHISRAFLSPTGPMADIRLETNRGDIRLTLPSSERPNAGAPILIMPVASQMEQVKPSPIIAETLPPTPVVEPSLPAAPTLLGWPAMETALGMLAQENPAIAASMADKTAAGGAKLTNSLLFFMMAAGRKSPDMWIGQEAGQILAKQNESLLSMLRADLSKLMTMAIDTGGEWRPVMLPLDSRDNDMSFLAFLLRNDHDSRKDAGEHGSGAGSEEEDKHDNQRFIVEVHFSVLGPVQLDGKINDKHFDLTLRSENHLPPVLVSDIHKLFYAALDASNFEGRMVILDATPFPVNVEDVLAGSAARAS